MLNRLRSKTADRDVFVALASLALFFTLLFPAGFMPGTSLDRPIVPCSGQGAMPGLAMPMAGMAHGKHQHRDPTHKGADDQACPFAAMAIALPPAQPVPVIRLAPAYPPPGVARSEASAPGRGMAAPPPPSHAPPALSA